MTRVVKLWEEGGELQMIGKLVTALEAHMPHTHSAADSETT